MGCPRRGPAERKPGARASLDGPRTRHQDIRHRSRLCGQRGHPRPLPWRPARRTTRRAYDHDQGRRALGRGVGRHRRRPQLRRAAAQHRSKPRTAGSDRRAADSQGHRGRGGQRGCPQGHRLCAECGNPPVRREHQYGGSWTAGNRNRNLFQPAVSPQRKRPDIPFPSSGHGSFKRPSRHQPPLCHGGACPVARRPGPGESRLRVRSARARCRRRR